MEDSAARSVAVVFNGAKSRPRLDAFCARARERLEPGGGRLTVYAAGSSAEVTALAARAVAEEHDTLVAAGGDGTLFHLLRGASDGLDRDAVVVGTLPLGTSNDFARALGVRDDATALAVLIDVSTRRVDLAHCRYVGFDGAEREDAFCLSAGVGFTAAVARSESSRVMAFLKPHLGDGAFVLSSARQIMNFRGARARLELDERRLDTTISLFEITKVPGIGGMPLTPHARLDSGTLELCLLHETSRLRRLHLLVNLQFSDSHVRWPDVEYVSDRSDPSFNRAGASGVRSIALQTDGPLPLHIHGEFLGHTPARFWVDGRQLRVLAPAQ